MRTVESFLNPTILYVPVTRDRWVEHHLAPKRGPVLSGLLIITIYTRTLTLKASGCVRSLTFDSISPMSASCPLSKPVQKWFGRSSSSYTYMGAPKMFPLCLWLFIFWCRIFLQFFLIFNHCEGKTKACLNIFEHSCISSQFSVFFFIICEFCFSYFTDSFTRKYIAFISQDFLRFNIVAGDIFELAETVSIHLSLWKKRPL